MRSAGSLSSAGLVPREVEHFSRYSPSPLSMKQLLDFGERGRRARAGALGLGYRLYFQSLCKVRLASVLKAHWDPLCC